MYTKQEIDEIIENTLSNDAIAAYLNSSRAEYFGIYSDGLYDIGEHVGDVSREDDMPIAYINCGNKTSDRAELMARLKRSYVYEQHMITCDTPTRNPPTQPPVCACVCGEHGTDVTVLTIHNELRMVVTDNIRSVMLVIKDADDARDIGKMFIAAASVLEKSEE